MQPAGGPFARSAAPQSAWTARCPPSFKTFPNHQSAARQSKLKTNNEHTSYAREAQLEALARRCTVALQASHYAYEREQFMCGVLHKSTALSKHHNPLQSPFIIQNRGGAFSSPCHSNKVTHYTIQTPEQHHGRGADITQYSTSTHGFVFRRAPCAQTSSLPLQLSSLSRTRLRHWFVGKDERIRKD